jgi:lipopolysaccharide transport system ATP-binding protein
MSSDQIAIRVTNLSKRYEIYEKPGDRLKQFLVPRLAKFFGSKHKQYFKEFGALNDISFHVKKGETLAIIGRNGSGKSTLLQIICGTLSPTSGLVETNGRIAALLELGSGFNPDFTGRENVYLNASVLGLSKDEIDSRLQDIIAFADIGQFIDQPTKTYSSGMLVRLAFAVIAHVDADILIVDEALAVGDVIFTQKCFRFINEFKKHGAILFVSHDSGAVANISNRSLWLQAGNSLKLGLTADVLDAYHKANLLVLDEAAASEVVLHKKDAGKLSDPVIFSCENHLNPKASYGGYGKATITSASILRSATHEPLQIIRQVESVILLMAVSANEALDFVLFGFTIKDRLGQKIIEENTFFNQELNTINLKKGDNILVKFNFSLPLLKQGKYSVDLAIAEGTQSSHTQQCWIYDALQFEVFPEREVLGVFSQALPQCTIERIS